MNNFNVAIIGAGFMGAAHTEALRRLGINVAGILGSSAEKSTSAANQLGISKGYSDLEELLADEMIDAVHVTSPNRFHYEHVAKILKSGKHVHCEKPLAMTTEESRAMVQMAKESNLAAGVNYNLRFYPLNLEVRDMIERGALGKVLAIQGSYVQDWLLYDTDYNWRVLADEGGKLRAVADIGTHWLDLVQSITALPIEAVFADLTTIHPTRQRPKGEIETFSGKVADIQTTEEIQVDTEDMGSVLLRFKGGGRGMLWVSQVTAGRKNSLKYEISGTHGAVSWNSENPNDLWIGHRNEPNQQLFRDPALVSDAARAHITYPGGHNEGYDDTHKQSFKSFYNYIETGDFSVPQPFPSFEEAHKEIVLCEAILRSHEEQQWIEIAD